MKLFVAELGSPKMVQFDRSVPDQDKVVSTLTSVEARSAIRRLEKTNWMTNAQAAVAIDAVRYKISLLVEQNANALVLQAAGIVIDRHGLRALDALQLGTALVARDLLSTPNMRFISSDKALLQAARLEGFQTWDPCD